MSKNKSSIASKGLCYSKTTISSSHTGCRTHKHIPKKIIPSKKITASYGENKSCSTSVVETKKHPTKARKTTKSDANVIEKCQIKNIVDYCKKCGDAVDKNQTTVSLKEPEESAAEKIQSTEEINKIVKAMNVKSVRNDNCVNKKKKSLNPIQQYYKNENFQLSTESVQVQDAELRKNFLDTINEDSEFNATSQDSVFMIYSDSDDDITFLDPDDDDNIEKLKQFRDKNYFECHSAKSRIKSRPSATSLNNHKCVYRFYLNDRLFPVPLNTDYNNKVRCVECHLPMDIKRDSNDEKINGTIQAKVKLGKETQDMVLLLPIKETLIIEERRKEERQISDEYVYFGVVKLSNDGNSMFNKTLPQDSLALKYQKGYKELQINERYKYKNVDDNDIIVI